MLRIGEAQKLRRLLDGEMQSLLNECHSIAWAESVKCSHEVLSLETIAEVVDPQPDHRTPPEMMDGLPYVSIANISLQGSVDLTNARKVSPEVVTLQEASFSLRTGDIVLGKIGTIGAARPLIVSSRFALSANVVLVQPNRDKVIPAFLLALLRSAKVGAQFATGTRRTAQEAFGIKKMRKLIVPIPSLHDQIRITNLTDRLNNQIDAAKRLQVTADNGMASLIPSILNLAFSG
jgi:type I restriction enzyme S subunit